MFVFLNLIWCVSSHFISLRRMSASICGKMCGRNVIDGIIVIVTATEYAFYSDYRNRTQSVQSEQMFLQWVCCNYIIRVRLTYTTKFELCTVRCITSKIIPEIHSCLFPKHFLSWGNYNYFPTFPSNLKCMWWKIYICLHLGFSSQTLAIQFGCNMSHLIRPLSAHGPTIPYKNFYSAHLLLLLSGSIFAFHFPRGESSFTITVHRNQCSVIWIIYLI